MAICTDRYEVNSWINIQFAPDLTQRLDMVNMAKITAKLTVEIWEFEAADLTSIPKMLDALPPLCRITLIPINQHGRPFSKGRDALPTRVNYAL